jgi:hypothetical protein
MKKKIIGILVCMILIGTFSQTRVIVIGKSEISENKISILNNDKIGIKGIYRSLMFIASPDGNNYSCKMYCNDHTQTLKWISLIDQLGFEKVWQKQFIKLTIIFILPGSIFIFGLDDFLLWYSELFIKQRNKAELLNCLNNYDELNGTGTITYSWDSGLTNKQFDFKIQPDNSWIENSWILEGINYIPNPEIWEKIAPLP